MLDTPVLLLVFNRPDTTRRVFEAIRQAKPGKLFVAADGPRAHRPGDADLCARVREIVTRVDWDCEVKTLFRAENLGCGKAVSGAITWFFEQVEEGIILEDDTVPGASFFPYCAELLSAYRHKPRVMHVSGTSFQFGRQRGQASYFFANYFHVWGWATWRRAWQWYDFTLDGWEAFQANQSLRRVVKTESEYKYWRQVFTNVRSGKIDTWDYQWLFSIWASGGLCVTPNVNLVSNIGEGEHATHSGIGVNLFGLPAGNLPAVVHPAEMRVCRAADRYTYRNAVNPPPTLLAQVRNQLSTLLPASARKAIKRMI
jgi:hypothetical protein